MSNSLDQGTQHARFPCPSRVCSDSCPLSRWCHPTISSTVTPFSSCPQYFPASGSFSVSWLFTSGGQSIGALASALPVNIQDWFSLRLTGLISLLSKELSKSLLQYSLKASILSALSILYSPTLISLQNYWKNQSFNYMDLCQQNDVSAF